MKPDPGRRVGDRGFRGHRRRRTARRVALDILYQADVLARSPRDVTREWREAGKIVPDYAEELVGGVQAGQAEIDAILGTHAEGWTVPRMAVVDRTILRVACYEIRSGVPVAVAINEAVEAANELSTEDSGRFINGVLGRIARDDPQPG
jgi:transcription antitermination protein NusB